MGTQPKDAGSMLRAACWIASRQAFERPVRTILTVAGIALGVSVAIAIPTANEEVLKSFQDTVTAVAGRATLQVSGGELGLDEGVIPMLLAHPAVTSASPVLSQGGRLVAGAHRGQPLMLMGLDLLDAPDLKGITVRTDSELGEAAERIDALLAPDAIFIGRRLADDWALHTGSPLDLLVGTRVHHLVVRGVVESSGGGVSAWSQMAVMDIASAQVQFGLVGRLDRIDLVTDPGKPVAEVARNIQAMLPPALTVSRPARRNEQVERMVRAFQLNLATLSAVGLLVGLLIVYNTVSFTVVRKRREIGILRAVGMSRQGVVGLFLVQAAVMGLMGGVLGSGLGVVLARGLVAILARTVSDLYAPVSGAGDALLIVSPARLCQGLLVGLLVSMAGAFLPSLEAGRTVPSRALAPGSYEVEQHLRAGRLAWVGVGGLLLAWLLALPGPIDGLPLFGYASAFCLLLSLSCFAPGIVGLIGWLLMRLAMNGGGARVRSGWIGRIGAIGRLAIGQVAQAPGRSAVTISALMVAIAIMVGVGTMVRSFRSTVELWINQTVMADLIVAPASWLDGDEAGMPAKRLPLSWAERLAAVPGVAAVDPYRQVRMEIQGRPASLVARDLRLHGERSRYLFLAGDPVETLDRTVSGQGVILSEVLARTLTVGTGDVLRMMTPAGERSFPILGLFYDYATDGGKVVMDGALYRRFWPDDTATVFALYLDRRQDAALVRQRVQEQAAGLAEEESAIAVIPNAELKADILAIFDRTFRVTYALELIVVIIALLGIVNTLLTSVLERQKELATLRAIGAGRRQIEGLILGESCYLALLGALLGLIGGGLLSVLLINVINTQSFGWTIRWTLPVGLLVEAVGLALVVALLAGYAPARWAGQQPLVEGLRYE